MLFSYNQFSFENLKYYDLNKKDAFKQAPFKQPIIFYSLQTTPSHLRSNSFLIKTVIIDEFPDKLFNRINMRFYLIGQIDCHQMVKITGILRNKEYPRQCAFPATIFLRDYFNAIQSNFYNSYSLKTLTAKSIRLSIRVQFLG